MHDGDGLGLRVILRVVAKARELPNSQRRGDHVRNWACLVKRQKEAAVTLLALRCKRGVKGRQRGFLLRASSGHIGC